MFDPENLTDHEKAMIAKARGQTAEVDANINPPATPPATPPADTETPPADTPPAATERPEWCPEEFWNAETGAADTEALARKYAELAAAKETPPGETPPQEPAAPSDPPFIAAVEAASAEMMENGKLSDESYAGFEKLGLSREHVDAYIEGQQAKAQLVQMRVFGEVGGEENLKQMIAWGINNYTETERTMFDKMMHSGDIEQAMAATRSLAARYNAAEGKPGTTVTPQGQSTASPTGYMSKDEVVAAMKKPEYTTSAAYRAEVQANIEAALKAGRNLGF